MNRLEIEIANHKMQAEACESLGNKEEAQHKWFIYDCLSALKDIHETGNCNNCTNKNCGYLPEVGKMVRYNCPFYKKEETEKWNGYHGQIEAPKGTFNKIYEDCKKEGD